MTRFLESVPLVFTPLTPIHIGCGEVFEPTNYVIEGNALYEFEPARLSLSDADRRTLVQSVNRQGDDAIRAVQRFFHDRRLACRNISRLTVPVADGVTEQYEKRIGQVSQREASGRAVTNLLDIERTTHHPHTGKPYMPGSGLKGAMRTAWLSRRGAGPGAVCDSERGSGQKANELERHILGLSGDGFSSDPFRLVAVADASGEQVTTRVVFAVNRRKKRPSGERNLSVCCEVVGGGQLRCLSGEIRFLRPDNSAQPPSAPAPDRRIGNFAALAQACNEFYRERMNAELDLWDRLSGADWTNRIKQLIEALGASFRGNQALLLRVGRHSGAESVTLDDWRCIQIRGARNERRWAREAATIWLATDDKSASSGMLPFGWVLAERADTAVPAPLQRWCEVESKRWAPAGPAETLRTGCVGDAGFADVTVWSRARLRFNKNNGTLTAIGPQNAEAYAHAPRGEQLLSGLSQELQAKVRAGQFLQVVANVRRSEIVAVRAK